MQPKKINTEANFVLLKTLFNGKYELVEELQKAEMPKFTLNEKSILALCEVEQKLILNAYSFNTIKNCAILWI